MSGGRHSFGQGILPLVGVIPPNRAEDQPPPAPRAKAVIKKCRGSRTEHLWEPEWEGRSYAFMKCRWCGKREAV